MHNNPCGSTSLLQKIEDVFDLMEMENDEREELLQLSPSQMRVR